MTQEELNALVASRISAHLLSEYWSGLAQGTKNAALSMATVDCLSYLGWKLDELTATSPMMDMLCDALAEQSIFLTRHYEEGESGRIVASESAGGVSQSYAISKGVADGGILATRAKLLLDTMRKKASGSLRIFRG